MAAAITITPASGSVTATSTVCRVDVTGADPNTTQRLKATKAGATALVGPTDFRPSSDGKHTWFSVIFPSSGSWTLTLYKSSDSTSLATAAVTVA